jgi:hypothetical protein
MDAAEINRTSEERSEIISDSKYAPTSTRVSLDVAKNSSENSGKVMFPQHA